MGHYGAVAYGEEQLLDVNKMDAGDINDLGVEHFNAGRFDQAIELYNKALEKAQKDNLIANIFFNLSSAYLEKGYTSYWPKKDDSFYKQSLHYADKCLKIRPYFWQASANKATVYMNMGNYEQSDRYFIEAEKNVDPNSTYYQQLLSQHSMVIGALELEKLNAEKNNTNK